MAVLCSVQTLDSDSWSTVPEAMRPDHRDERRIRFDVAKDRETCQAALVARRLGRPMAAGRLRRRCRMCCQPMVVPGCSPLQQHA